MKEELLGEPLRRQVPSSTRHLFQVHRGSVDGLVLTQHARELGTQRIGEWKDGAHCRRTLAARERREESEWRQRDLFFPHEVRIQHRGERARCGAHLTRRLRRQHERLVDLPVLGANRCRNLEKPLHRRCAARCVLCRQCGCEHDDRERTDECAAM